MGNPVKISVSANVQTTEGGVQELLDKVLRYALVTAAGNGTVNQVRVAASGFTAFTVPTNWTPRYCLVVAPAGSEGLTLKGVTGDTGIKGTSSTTGEVNEMVWLVPVQGASASIGMANAGDGNVDLTVIMI